MSVEELFVATGSRTMRLRDGVVAASCLPEPVEALGEMRRLIVGGILDSQLVQASLLHHAALLGDDPAEREALLLILAAEQRLLSALLEIAETASSTDPSEALYALESIVDGLG
jgi:hypothetical protein